MSEQTTPPRRRRLAGLSFNRMIPNILTLLALCAGLTAIRFGLGGEWENAVLAVMVAAILDGLDGRLARILKGASKFGAELDSLADFVSFGVVPGLLLFLWTMDDLGRFGWILVLIYIVACVLRLARFNTFLEDPDRPAWASNFFTGVPAPMGAALVLLPMMLSFQFDANFFRSPALVSVFLVGVGALMVSRLPTFSFKKFKVPNHWVLPTMLIVGLYGALLINAPWMTIAVTLLAYTASLPFGYRAYRRMAERTAAAAAEPAATPDAAPNGVTIFPSKSLGHKDGRGPTR
ncbi:CDP-alcohol phosphatidyltransferase family protein [Shumkonia mesophila]|uniref:CDP-alcohol phosphatidyltransferase family protein n=1 Tax=Shumkonia mesophila TaxID=2838854 RepID=UPI0029348912|nr:phosphatidylcholine/phosphatidylserine synthase [Shumkonia mesophila]